MMTAETTSGLGLGALFEEEDDNPAIAALEEKIRSAPESERKRHMIGTAQICPNPYQPRRIFSDETLRELAESIRQYGILQPLLVRERAGEPGEYEIIAGERRWQAAQIAQLHEVPVIILDVDELAAFRIALIENLQREDLNPIDEALGYKRLMEEYNETQEDVAGVIGKSLSHIRNMVRLLNLPDTVQTHLGAGDISMGHARALITAEDPEKLARAVIAKGLSVRQTEKLAADAKGVPQKKYRSRASSSAPAKDADTIALENDMSNALGMRVTIDSTDGKSGRLSVEFRSLDQLDELLHRLAHFPGARLKG